MMTVRQIQRYWGSKSYVQLFRELTKARPEASLQLEHALGNSTAVAAMTLVRLDELCQNSVSLYGELIRTVLSEQQPDGGWGDPMTTAICLKALLCGKGNGPAIERALQYLQSLQQPDGTWPAEPIRRMPADAYTTAYILLQLESFTDFRQAVRFAEAMEWLGRHEDDLDANSRRLWERVQNRTAFLLSAMGTRN